MAIRLTAAEYNAADQPAAVTTIT